MSGRLSVYTRLLGYLRPYRPQVLIAYISMFIATLLSLLVPQIIKQAIDYGLASGQGLLLVAPAG